MITKPLKFTGKKLLLNFPTSAAGGVRVEIQDAAGRPLPGFALSDAVEQIGNEIECAVTWRAGEDVSALAGQEVHLRFVMKDAELFSYRFRCTSATPQKSTPTYRHFLGNNSATSCPYPTRAALLNWLPARNSRTIFNQSCLIAGRTPRDGERRAVRVAAKVNRKKQFL